MAKSVVVTGGASGIGLAMSRHFASQGYRVAILDINSETGPEVAAEIAAEFPTATVCFKKCNVASWEEQAAVFEDVFHEHGNRIDIVMANAGINEGGPVTIVDLQEQKPSRPNLRTLDINLTGTIYSVKLAAHYMNRNPDGVSRGSIICTASNAGIYPLPMAPLYATTKFGVVGLVRSLARVLEKSNIQINALAPAVLETNISGPNSKEFFSKMVVTPMSTLIRGVADFIADPSVSGQVAEIHGDKVTIRPHHEWVDDGSRRNIEMFWTVTNS
ncbi:hypothetical protein QBC47DRAFT_303276 [Echria macrotheca]|uniref:Uncharacterized protein n=1 Tax=Echria macrotheca TaxID=438768 RepID=A0AAJ0F7P1_9PEZI|nr:hypothetical protein QBC47DRAFT_303276 [Echria macrotheca]